MLNPWHTYFRAGEQHVKEEKKNEGEDSERTWEQKINYWSDFCKIKNKDENIPNSILPFYSVDMMLNYLKHSLKTKDVLGGEYDDISKIIEIIIEKRRENYKKFFEQRC